jgi:prevent-host-death family protein
VASGYAVEIEASAAKSLQRLQRHGQIRVSKAIVALASEPRPNGCTKLTGTDSAYRIRVGDFRVVYEVEDAVRIVTVHPGRTPKGGLPMSNLVPISEARARLSQLVREASEREVVLMNHGRPAAILISVEQYESLLEETDDLRDRLSVHEREHVTMPFEKFMAELGIADEVELGDPQAMRALRAEADMPPKPPRRRR